jgi:hypothetical protein
MQDDRIADMARLTHFINAKKQFLVVNGLVSQLGLHTYTYFELPLLYKGNRPFLTRHSASSS